MTSKQVQKAHKAANKQPRLSRAEQAKKDRAEQERIRKEMDKERATAKARLQREKKKEKEAMVKVEKKRKRLPLVTVRPSQDTIARFVRKSAVKAEAEIKAEVKPKPILDPIVEDEPNEHLDAKPDKDAKPVNVQEVSDTKPKEEWKPIEDKKPEDDFDFSDEDENNGPWLQTDSLQTWMDDCFDESRLLGTTSRSTNMLNIREQAMTAVATRPPTSLAYREIDIDEAMGFNKPPQDIGELYSGVRADEIERRVIGRGPDEASDEDAEPYNEIRRHEELNAERINMSGPPLRCDSTSRRSGFMCSLAKAAGRQRRAHLLTIKERAAKMAGPNTECAENLDSILEDDLDDEMLRVIDTTVARHSPEKDEPKQETKEEPTERDRKRALDREPSSPKRHDRKRVRISVPIDEELGKVEKNQEPVFRHRIWGERSLSSTSTSSRKSARMSTPIERDLGIAPPGSEAGPHITPPPPVCKRFIPPMSTQAILFNPEDYFPTSSQELRELDEDISYEPSLPPLRSGKVPSPAAALILSSEPMAPPPIPPKTPSSPPNPPRRFFTSSGSNERMALALHRSRRDAAMEELWRKDRRRAPAPLKTPKVLKVATPTPNAKWKAQLKVEGGSQADKENSHPAASQETEYGGDWIDEAALDLVF